MLKRLFDEDYFRVRGYFFVLTRMARYALGAPKKYFTDGTSCNSTFVDLPKKVNFGPLYQASDCFFTMVIKSANIIEHKTSDAWQQINK